jgi:hypothetical protein
MANQPETRIFQGHDIKWTSRGIYALAVASRDSNWERFWFKLEKLDHVETAMEIGLPVQFINWCDTTPKES